MFRLILAIFAWVLSRMVAITPVHAARGFLGWQMQQFGPTPLVASSAATIRFPIFVAPFNCELGEISVITSILFSGADTNTVHLNVIDGGAEGAGTTQIANLDLTSGVDLAIGKTLLMDQIQGASASVFLSAGDIVELEVEEIGTGNAAALPNLLLGIIFRAANLAS